MVGAELRRVLDEVGITYRQYDYWLHYGLIPGDHRTGSGVSRVLTPAQRKHLSVMSELVKAGLKPGVASSLAERLLNGPDDTVSISENFDLVWKAKGGSS